MNKDGLTVGNAKYYLWRYIYMNEVLDKVFDHPISTAILVATITNCVIRAVRAVKGFDIATTNSAKTGS